MNSQEKSIEVDLTDIISEKEKANELTKQGLFPQAEKAYSELLNRIEEIIKNPSMREEAIIDTENMNELLKQKKLILSNLAMVYCKQGQYQKSKDCDKMIIKKLDPKFDKSYARLIDCYMKLNDFNLARYHYSLMKVHISQENINKYSDIINQIEAQIEKHDGAIKGLLSLKNVLDKR